MSIGERLQEIRNTLKKAKKVSNQSDMADLLNISQSAYSKLEKDVHAPSKETIQKLSELDVNLNWLFSGEGNMFMSKANNSQIVNNKSFVLNEQEEFKYKIISTMLKAVGITNFRITKDESIEYSNIRIGDGPEQIDLRKEVAELKEQVKQLIKNQNMNTQKLNSQNQ